METEEETSSTSSGSSEKSSSAKLAESESPEVTISPDQSNHSKPDRSSDSEPPCKIQKQDLTCSVTLKESGTSTEEETSSTSSGSSEKSSSAKLAESEYPEVAISPDQSNHSKPDRSSDKEPPCKIQKQDLTCSATLKEFETSSDSLKEEGQTSESPNTEDEVAMEVDEQLPSSEVPEKPITSGGDVKEQDSTICEPDSTLGESVTEQDSSVVGNNEKPRTPSPLMDVSCQSETSELTLTAKSVTLTEGTELPSTSTLTSDVSSKPRTSDKCLKRQEAVGTMDEDETLPSSIEPDISSNQKTDEESLRIKDLTASNDKVSPYLQSDVSNEQSQSGETMETQNPSLESGDLIDLGQSSENLQTDESKTMESTKPSTIQPDILSEPGPSGENVKAARNRSCLESGISSEPGPSGETLRASGSIEGVKLSLSSFNLDKGMIGTHSLDRQTCVNIQAELDHRLTSKHILNCYNRLRDSYVRQRRRQEDESKERQSRGGYSYEQIEGLENRDEISIRSWLKYSLPREADYLNSIAGQEFDSAPEPPPMEDDRTYSLSSGEIPVEDRVRWRRGIALGERLLRQAKLHEDCTPFGRHSRPNRDYDIEAHLTSDLMNLLNDLARRISDLPVDPILSPPDDIDSGNVSPGSMYLRGLPSIQEDDTSLGAETFRSEEATGAASMRLEEEFGATSSLRSSDNLSSRPISDQVARLLAEESFDSESSDSSTPYPKSIDTSEYQVASSVLDCSSIKEDISEATVSTAENPREDQVASGLAEVHIDNDDSESVSGLEVNLENDESESTPYPTTDETSSDRGCGYKEIRKLSSLDDESDGWC